MKCQIILKINILLMRKNEQNTLNLFNINFCNDEFKYLHWFSGSYKFNTSLARSVHRNRFFYGNIKFSVSMLAHEPDPFPKPFLLGKKLFGTLVQGISMPPGIGA